jgi:uncharacterized protein YbjT (DUF2867 family)
MKTEISNAKPSGGTTLVLGGTGKTGYRVAQRLRARGAPTRTASRSGTPAFIWNDRTTWQALLDGVTAAYIAYAPDLAGPGSTRPVREFVRYAVEAGVHRLVLLSGRGDEEAELCERVVQGAGVEWTIVRASWLNQSFSEGEFIGMVMDGAIKLPAADIPEPFVDVNDIADVAVAALTEDGHSGEIYEITSPHFPTFTDGAREISGLTGRRVQPVRVPMEGFAAAIADYGARQEIAWLLN